MTNPLLIAFGDGPECYSEERKSTLTGLEAWQLSKQDQSALNTVIGWISDETAQRLMVTPEALDLFSKDINDYLRRDHAHPIVSVVESAMKRTAEGKRFDPLEPHFVDPGSSKQYGPLPDHILQAYNAQRICSDKSRACHAPSTSMFFGRNGWVSACCVRRQPPYGIWPERTISEIWFGDERKQLDEALRNNILPNGCDVCADQILAGNFRGTVAASHDHVLKNDKPPADTASDRSWLRKLISGPRATPLPVDTGIPGYPRKLAFELSNKCNLECAMCSGGFSSLIRQNREHKPPLAEVYDDRFVQQLREFIPHLQQADFRGGEPFLIDIYYQIWEILIELNPACMVSITTNGTALSPKIKQILEKLNFHVIVSLDSLQTSTYESIRRNAKLDHVLANIDAIHEIATRRHKTMGLAFCAMPTNWHEVPDLLAFASARNASIRMNTVFFPAHSSIGSLPQDEQTRIAAFLQESLRPAKNEIEAANNRAVQGFCQRIEHWTGSPEAGELVQLS